MVGVTVVVEHLREMVRDRHDRILAMLAALGEERPAGRADAPW